MFRIRNVLTQDPITLMLIPRSVRVERLVGAGDVKLFLSAASEVGRAVLLTSDYSGSLSVYCWQLTCS